MNKLMPVYVSNTADVPKPFMDGVLEAIDHMLRIADVRIPVKYFGAFTASNGDYGSAEWYIRRAWNGTRGLVNAELLLNLMEFEPYQRAEEHYDVFVTGHDLWSGELDNNFVFGLTRPLFGTVQSIARLQASVEDIKTVTYHEVAHVFATPNPKRRVNRNISYAYGGAHCIVPTCSLRQANIPGHPTMQMVTRRRIQNGFPYCGDCAEDIRNYFRT